MKVRKEHKRTQNTQQGKNKYDTNRKKYVTTLYKPI